MTQSDYIRETPQYGVISEGIIEFEDQQEIRIERLYVRNTGEVEIRFSWWKHGRFIPRPMHATEKQLLDLFNEGLRAGVLSPAFRERLRQLL
ncbi:MAG TPA: hypothetical protein VMW13_01425 [Dehalococcoidales bacterium]|nr:hypothetical protein [Dehalococcoidales bacterium]